MISNWKSTYNTPDPMYTSSSIPVSAVRLVILHHSERKHISKEDMERLQSFGLVPLFVEAVDMVRLEPVAYADQ